MKASIFFLLALAAVASSSTSFRKAELGPSMMARITSISVKAVRQDEADPCSALCLVHFTRQHLCELGEEKSECNDDEYPVGPQDGCFCCLPLLP